MQACSLSLELFWPTMLVIWILNGFILCWNLKDIPKVEVLNLKGRDANIK